MATCLSCGHQPADTAKFCTACGTKMPVAAAASLETDRSVESAVQAQAQSVATAAFAATPEPALTAPAETAAAVEPGAPAVAPFGASTPPPVAGPATPAPAPAPASPYPNIYPEAGSVPPRSFNADGVAQAAGQARAQVAASVERIPLPSDQVTRALRDGVILAGLSWLVGTLVVVAVHVASGGALGGPLLWIRSGVAVLAAAVRATVRITGPFMGSDLGFSATFMPVALTVAILAGGYHLARRAQRASASLRLRDRALRAAIMGLAFGVAAALLGLVLKGRITPDGSVEIASSWFGMFLGGTCLVALAAFWGLGSRSDDAARIPAAVGRDIRTGLEFVTGSLLVALGLVIAFVVVAVVKQAVSGSPAPSLSSARSVSGVGDGDGLRAVLMSVLAIVLYAPTLLAQFAAVMLGGTFAVTFEASATSEASGSLGNALNRALSGQLGQSSRVESGPLAERFGLMEGNLPTQLVLSCLAACLVLVAVAGLRAALRRPGSAKLRWWQPALVAAGTWLVLAWLTSVNAVGDIGGIRLLDAVRASGEGRVHLGVSVWGTALAAGLLTAAAVFLGSWAAPQVGRAAPGVAARMGGRRMDEGWQLLLTDAMLRRAQQPPKHLAPLADALRTGRIAPPQQPLA